VKGRDLKLECVVTATDLPVSAPAAYGLISELTQCGQSMEMGSGHFDLAAKR